MSFILSLDQLRQGLDLLNQAANFLQVAYNSGFRGWRIWQTWNDPNINKVTKAFYIATDGISVATSLAALSPSSQSILDKEESENLRRVATITVLSADIVRLSSQQEQNLADVAVLGTDVLINVNQLAGGTQNQQQIINLAGSALSIYAKKDLIGRSATNLIRALRKLHPVQVDNALDKVRTQKGPKEMYQAMVQQARREYQGKLDDRGILEKVNEKIESELAVVRIHIKENKMIGERKQAKLFKRIPSVLRTREEFANKKCKISNYPIRRLVVIQIPGSKEVLNYDWKSLKAILSFNDENEEGKVLIPIDWPKDLLFSWDSARAKINDEETSKIEKALQKALLEPEVRALAKAKNEEYEKMEADYRQMFEFYDKDLNAYN